MTATLVEERPPDDAPGRPAAATTTGGPPAAPGTPAPIPTGIDPAVSVASEVALAGTTLAVVLGMGRLFSEASFLRPLLVVALLAHGLAAALRRTRLAPAAVAAVAALGGGIVLTWVLEPGTTFALLPTTTTFGTARTDLADAWHSFATVVAPTRPTAGFVLASAVAIWGVAWLADWAAFRLHAALEALLPAVAVFVFTTLLGSPRHRLATTVAFVATALAFLLLHRAARQARSTVWVGDRLGGRRSLLVAGLAVVALVSATGAVVGPLVPGSTSRPLLDWRGGDSPGTRVTVSPLVDIRKRLVDQSDTEVFTVRSKQRAYWRMSSLDTFDGTVWSSGGSFGRARGDLPETAGPPASTTIVQDYRITGLSAIWVPAAYRATSVASDGTRLRWDDESATLIVDTDSDTSDGISYQVTSSLPLLDRAELNRPDQPVPADVVAKYLAMPGDFPRSVATTAIGVTLRGKNSYQKALLLQNWFRDNFTYNLAGTRAGHSDRAIEDFLKSGEGYCEQFAGTYAAMARSIGLPSRVAVGFTPGEQDPDNPERYIVRGKHAHAWPEVYLGRAGWVPFEPTPGRGSPDGEAWTGVREQQAGGVPGQATTTTTTNPSAAIPSAPTSVLSAADRLRTEQGGTTGGPSGPSQVSRLGRVALIGLLAVLAWVLLLAAARGGRRFFRRRFARSPDQRVHLAWSEGTDAAAAAGAGVRSSETHREFAGRAGPAVGEAAGPLTALADLASVTTWSPADTAPEDAEEAARLSAEVGRRVRAALEPRQRLRSAVDPRPLLRR